MTDFGQLWVWRDPALARSLGWYAAVAANRKPAKFRIAATIPMSLTLKDASEQALWEELEGADLSGVVLGEANLRDVDVQGANLRGADLNRARMDGADLRKARLGAAFLRKTSLRGADLRGAYLRLARFESTDVSAADLRDVEGLTQKQIDVAVCDRQTKLPDGFQIRAHDGG